MNLQKRKHRATDTRRGLSLAEVMISLAITSMLLTAIAAAFSSSTTVIENNDRFFRATQSARVTLNQVLTEVRRADAIGDLDIFPGNDPTSTKVSSTLIPIIRPDETRPANEKMRFYEYDAVNKRVNLYFLRTDNTLSPRYPIATEVQSAPFSWDTGKDANNADCIARISVALDVKVGNNDIHLSGSTAPRRSLAYK
ncbi:MAG TPA: prepilin-type N-terminal cleavage/methylation domain-containing protein [Tepidisphaeraceae bacterium]|jgi:prepilin-type N-terminal cleavage/methylation domain-containing protein